jgi:hypothetical protein
MGVFRERGSLNAQARIMLKQVEELKPESQKGEIIQIDFNSEYNIRKF